MVSRDNAAYTYLPESVNRFPERKDFILELEKVGFNDCIFKPLSFGIATIYVAKNNI
jgi:demethylmenaquinone methyltransferase/2-methoxy-6-polyprenyl-1,4-benzoquinol methylase